MSTTHPAPEITLAERFGLILDMLRRTAAARLASNRAATPVLLILWSHLHRLSARFASLVARVGTRVQRAPRPAQQPAAGLPRPRLPRPRLPGGFGWLTRLVPETRAYASQMQYLLSQPEMVALLDAEPRFGRLLRPFCRMLAIELPPAPADKDTPPRTRNTSLADRPEAQMPEACAPASATQLVSEKRA